MFAGRFFASRAHWTRDSLHAVSRSILRLQTCQGEQNKLLYSTTELKETLPSHIKLRMPDLHFEQLSSSGKVGCKLREWFIEEGDCLKENDPLCQIETPDLVFTLESGDEGYVAKIFVHPSDDDVAVGRPLAVFVPSKDDIAPFLACLEASPHLIEGYKPEISEKSKDLSKDTADANDSEGSSTKEADEKESTKILRLLKQLEKERKIADESILKVLKSLARKGNEQLYVTYRASFSSDSKDFDTDYFIENALEVAEEINSLMHFAAIIICCVHGLSYGSTSDVVSQQISDLGRVKAYPDLNGAIFEHMPTNAIEMASGPPQTQDQLNYGQTIGQVLALLSLLVLSGLFAGLGLGLMSLNLTELKILAEVGDDNEASLDEIKRGKAAKSIITIRSKGHLLLTTLLLGSVAVNSLASIVAADLTTGVWGFLVSTALIVIFGEIIPQSLCSKYAVEIGGKSVPFVRFVILLFYVVARPVSMILDHFLGTETDTLLTNNQMRQLIQIHSEEGIIDGDENQLLLAALTHHDRIATDIMTKNDRIFKISSQAVLTTTLLQELRQRGFSRVPIYDESPDDIIGILYLKDLILLDPAKETAVIDVIQRRKRNIVRVDGSCSLNALLEKFKSIGRSTILVEEPKAMKETRGASRLLGIVTMSDVVSALLPGISQEKEKKNLAQLSVRSSKSAQHSEWDLNADGMIAVETLAKQLQLSDNIFSAVTSSGSKLSINQLANFLANCEIVHYNANGSDEIILRRNEEISYSLLLLHGRVRMAKGSEIEQDCEIGSVFALDCLKMQDEAYLTDFELKTVPNVSTKCLQIPRLGFRNLLRNDEASPPM